MIFSHCVFQKSANRSKVNALILAGLCLIFISMVVGERCLAGSPAQTEIPMIEARFTIVDPVNGTVLWKGGQGESVELGTLTLVGMGEVDHIESSDQGATVHYRNGWYGPKGLKVTYTPMRRSVRVTYQIAMDLNELKQAGGKKRLRVLYPEKGLLPQPMSTQRRNRIDAMELLYGPATLSLRFEDAVMGWIGGNAKRAQINLNEQGLEELVGDGLAIRVMVQQGADQIVAGSEQLDTRIHEARAYLEAIRRWDFPADMTAPVLKMDGELNQLVKDLHAFRDSLQGDLDAMALRKRWQDTNVLDERMTQIEGEIQQFLKDHREALFERSREFNETMRYRVGLATTHNPWQYFEKWALFNLNGMRIPFSAPSSRGDSQEERLAKLRDALNEAQRYGAKVNELAIGGSKEDKTPVDIVFTHEYMPSQHSGFSSYGVNSVWQRDEWAENLKFWAENTQDLGTVITYKIGNEPFWSTGSRLPVKGYGQAIVGCSPQTFQKYVRERYGSFEKWHQAASEQKTYPAVASWQRFEDMAIDDDATKGLTFVAYLKQKYGDLESLNETWFGSASDSRAFGSWEEVFPPRPIDGAKSSFDTSLPQYDLDSGDIEPSQNPLPTRAEDIPAWTDFMRFWSLCLNNRLVDLSTRTQQAVPGVNVSTNSITGHFMNGYRRNAVTTSLNPWLSSKDLPSLHIDFYSVGYLHAYMRALAGAAEGRPFYISEAGGSDSRQSAAYMAMYAFAYGADGMTYWRRDHRMPPESALGVSDAMRLLNEPKLQQDSQVVTDGLALMYSLDSLFLANSLATDALYLHDLQGAAMLMSRMQVLYDMYSDEYLARRGVPENIKVLLAPQAFAVDPQAFTAIQRFVEAGGVLMTTPNFGRFDAHGHKRAASDLDWLEQNEHVVMLPEDALEQWRRSDRDASDHHPMEWAKPLPSVADQIEQVLAEYAPRTVTYRIPSQAEDAALPSYAPGVRRASDGTLYVFVDPWAEATNLQVHGAFNRAVDLATGQALPVKSRQNYTDVSVQRGPTIVRLEP